MTLASGGTSGPKATLDMALATTQRAVRPSTEVEIFGKTDVGRVRTNNEDSFVVADLAGPDRLHSMTAPIAMKVNERGVLLAVSDGMGGEQAGEVASALVLQALRRNLTSVNAETAEAALRASVEKANTRVFTAAQESGRAGMGATLTAVLFHGPSAYIAEIGDSRAYLLRGEKLVPLTRDQSLVQHLIDSGGITREEAETSPYKSVILQAMGTKPSVVVAMNRLSVRRGDRFLLCSDGLSGKVTDDEMCSLLRGPVTVQASCDALIALALERGGDDNITVIVAELAGEGVPPLTDGERISLQAVQAFVPASSGG